MDDNTLKGCSNVIQERVYSLDQFWVYDAFSLNKESQAWESEEKWSGSCHYWLLMKVKSESESHCVLSNSLWPHGYSPWNSPDQNTAVSSHSLLWGIFLTQELNWGLLHCRQILYQLSWVTNKSTSFHLHKLWFFWFKGLSFQERNDSTGWCRNGSIKWESDTVMWPPRNTHSSESVSREEGF